MNSKMFSNITKGTAKKAPSFFDSSYHLRNYTQLVVNNHHPPELFTPNTSNPKPRTNSNSNNNTSYNRQSSSQNNNNQFPNFSHGIFSYYSTLSIDPYTTSLAFHGYNNHHAVDEEYHLPFNNKVEFAYNNNNNNNVVLTGLNINNDNSTAAGSGVNVKIANSFIEPPSTSINTEKLQPEDSISPSPSKLLKYTISGKRNYATIAGNSDGILKRNRSYSDTSSKLFNSLILNDQHQEDSISKKLQKTTSQQVVYDPIKKQHHIKKLKAALDYLPINSTVRNIAKVILNCVIDEKTIEIYPLYQALKRNEAEIPLDIINVVLYSLTIRKPSGGQSVENKLTTLLNVYSDLVSSGRSIPNDETYEIVLNGLFDGAFNNYNIYLNNESVEEILEEDGVFYKRIVDNGENYFRLGLEIFMASNFTKIHQFDQKTYESLLTGLAIYDFRFKDVETLQKFFGVLKKCSFKKTEIYYSALIKYGVSISLTENINKKFNNNNGYKFMLSIYNQYKEDSKTDSSLLKFQYNIYGVLFFSLCELKEFNAATKILDELLIQHRKNQNNYQDLEKTVLLYLFGLINNGKYLKSMELFEQFSKFKVINFDNNKNQFLLEQYYVNLVFKLVEDSNLETSKLIFAKLMNLIQSDSSNESDINSRFNLFLQSLVKKSNGLEESNNLVKVISNYFEFLIENNSTKEILKFFEFNGDNNELTNESKFLIKKLNNDGIYYLTLFGINNRLPNERLIKIFEFLNLNHESKTFNSNEILTKLFNCFEFLKFLQMKDNRFLELFLSSNFFTNCINEFSLKKYIDCSKSSFNFNYNNYYGLILISYGYLNSPVFKNELVERNLQLLKNEFESLDNFYLKKEVSEEVNLVQENNLLNKSNEIFYGQLNILKEFETKLNDYFNEQTEEPQEDLINEDIPLAVV